MTRRNPAVEQPDRTSERSAGAVAALSAATASEPVAEALLSSEWNAVAEAILAALPDWTLVRRERLAALEKVAEAARLATHDANGVGKFPRSGDLADIDTALAALDVKGRA